MARSVILNYGDRTVRLPPVDHATMLTVRDPRPSVSSETLAADLDEFLGARSLEGRRVAVVVADKTRLCNYDRFLPVLLERLEIAGADPSRIRILIAYGTHLRQSDAESRSAYGKVFSRYRFIQHDCTDAAVFEDLGRTRRGTPIRLRRDILDADMVVTFGAISHHYFAGYGGGRKLIFPGLGERSAIYHNHGLYLDVRQRRLASGCRPGCLDGNPLAEDLAEVERRRPAELALHAIIDSHGKVCRIMVGNGVQHFLDACAAHAHNCETTAAQGYDLVVASCGGMPKDINLIQAHKAMHHAAAFVNDGGRLILFAQCRDGVGSGTFLPWFDMGWDAAFDRLQQDYQGNGGTALAMMEKARRIRIDLVSDLPPNICKIIGVARCDARSAANIVTGHHGDIAVIPNASLLVRPYSGNDRDGSRQ